MNYIAFLLCLLLKFRITNGYNKSFIKHGLHESCEEEFESKLSNDIHFVNSEKVECAQNRDIFKFNINNIIEDLLRHQWKDEETLCLKKVIDLLENVKNRTLWATWIWDSMQMPTGVLYGNRHQLGNFDECLQPPWKQTHPDIQTQYCIADVVLAETRIKYQEDPFSSAETYFKSMTKNELKMNSIVWGVCLPVSCLPQSAEKFLSTLLRNSHLSFTLSELSITVDSCQSYSEGKQMLHGYYAIVVLFGVMITLVTWATYYYKYKERATNVVSEIAKGLSVVENTAALCRVRNNEILIINFFKTCNSALVVYLHIFCISASTGLSNALDFDRKFEYNFLYLSYHLDVCVDTYILISGILSVKGFLENKSSFDPFRIIVKRYFRLASPMMVIIFLVSQSQKQLQSGPLISKTIQIDYDACRENWWLNVLMINNYVNYSNTCYIVTWYVSCDFQLTILGTFLYFLYKKKERIGITVFIMATFASILLPAVTTYNQQLLAFPIFNIEAMKNLRQTIENVPTYLHSHLRAGPYLVGIAIGYILSIYKPSGYKLSKLSSMIYIFIASVLALWVLIVGGNIAIREYDVIESSIFGGINRSIWAVAMGSFILVHEYGYLPIIHDFVKLPYFGVISKLNYGIYLTHWAFMSIKVFSSRSAIFFDIIYTVVDSLGVMCCCCFISYIMWILFEAPVNNIVSIILRYRSVKIVKE